MRGTWIKRLACDAIRGPLNWMGRRHPLWFILPFMVSIAAGTFPSAEGYICASVATVIFFLCLIGWRINVRE